MSEAITSKELAEMMAQAEAETATWQEDYIEVKTRILDEEEIRSLHAWMIALPETVWSREDADLALVNLLDSHQGIVILPVKLKSQAAYCKLTWG